MNTTMVRLTKDVSFIKDDLPVLIIKGTVVQVDVEKNIAFSGIDHFEIFNDEYFLYMN